MHYLIINDLNMLTNSKIQKRLLEIQQCKNMITCCKVEEARLKRKRTQLDLMYKKNITLTLRGTIEEIEQSLKIHKKEKQEIILNKSKINKEILINRKYFINNTKKIERLNQLTVMEEEVNTYKKNTNKKITNSNSNNLKNDSLLSSIDNLPNELKIIIQEYFTYDTRAALLESKYKPLNIIQKMNAKLLKKLIQVIFHKEIYRFYEYSLKQQMVADYCIFYNTYIVNEMQINRYSIDEKTFLSYIIINMNSYPKILYGIYKFLILLDISIKNINKNK